MKYFNNCKDLNEVKATFKNLAKQFHPDLSGFDSTVIMQEINKEYAYAIAHAAKFGTKSTGEKYTEREINEEILNAEEYQNCLNIILKLEGLTIVLAGSWLWISGNTYPHKKKLKEANCTWCSTKKMWSFKGVDHNKEFRGKPMEINSIYQKHGYKELSGRKQFSIA